MGVQLLSFAEVCQILMIGKDNSWELGSLDVVLPCAEGTHDAKELAVVDLVVPFSRFKGLGQEGTGVFDAIHCERMAPVAN